MPSTQAPLPDSFAKGDNPMPSSFDDDLDYNEGRFKKFKRKLIQDPLIPVGLGLTTWALWGAQRSIKAGTKTKTNMFFRLRVYAQAFTLVMICVGGAYWKEDRAKRKQYNELMAEQKAQEKRDAWIRELELRDEEEKAERAKRKRRAEAARRKAQEGAGEGQEASSALSQGDLVNVVGGSGMVGTALAMFRRRTRE